jgi:hypothetical protein
MTHRHRLLAPTLLFDLSLPSSRHLGRLFSQSEAPFWTARNQFRFRLLPSDSPLYFMSFGSLRLNARKHANEDRYCVRMLDVYEAAKHSAGSHSRKIGARSKLDHVLLRGTVGPSLVRNQQPSGPHAGTPFLGWLKQFFGVRFVRFHVSVAKAVCDCPLLKLFSIPNMWSLLSCAATAVQVRDQTRGLPAILREVFPCALGRHTRKTERDDTKTSIQKEHIHALQPRTPTLRTIVHNRRTWPARARQYCARGEGISGNRRRYRRALD